MNWSKAKTILIIALIIMNLFFFISFKEKEANREDLTSEEYIKLVESTLGLEGIEIAQDIEIPLKEISLVPLNVEYEMLKIEDINKKLFKEKGILKQIKNGYKIYNEDEKLELYNNGLLEYNRLDLADTNITKEEAEKHAKAFLKELNLDTENLKLYNSEITDEGYRLDYSAIYKGKYLEDAKAHIIVDDKGVKKLYRYWLNVDSAGKKEIKLQNGLKALLELVNMEKAHNKKIINIDEAYYFKDIPRPDEKDSKEALKGKTVPAWRIQFEDGTVILIGEYRR